MTPKADNLTTRLEQPEAPAETSQIIGKYRRVIARQEHANPRSDVEHQLSYPDPLAPEAFHGPAGEFVNLVAPHTEADPAALLLQFLVGFGNVIGRGPFFRVEADAHRCNLNVILVGQTSRARKGTSHGHVRARLQYLDEEWSSNRILSGLSSGEGLIHAVRDPADGDEEDAGIVDKRLALYEPEFASTLRVMSRQGNTLSAIIRQAWDDGCLRVLTRNNPVHATDSHISITAHITRDELRRYLDSTEQVNGFCNRFLFACVRRSKILPEGGDISTINFEGFDSRLRTAFNYSRKIRELKRDEAARSLWADVYPGLSEGRLGMFGAAIARAEAQVTRLSLLYALLDRSKCIGLNHIQAALAVWQFCEASAGWVFGDSLGDPLADQILVGLETAPTGMTRTEINNALGRHRDSLQIARALGVLAEHGLASCRRQETGGRTVEVWFAHSSAKKANNAN